MSLSRLLGATMIAGASAPGEEERGIHAHSAAGAHARDSDERLLVQRVQRLLGARRAAPRLAPGRGGRRGRFR